MALMQSLSGLQNRAAPRAIEVLPYNYQTASIIKGLGDELIDGILRIINSCDTTTLFPELVALHSGFRGAYYICMI
mgnify:CR=1 FL=1